MTLILRIHAVQRMAERGITVEDVRAVLGAGETIEDYPSDTPFPSRLVLGRSGGRAIHVVAAYDRSRDSTIVITVYEPDPTRWEADLRTRKR